MNMPQTNSATVMAVMVVLGFVVLQVFIPALFDLVVSLGIALGAGFAGYTIGKGTRP